MKKFDLPQYAPYQDFIKENFSVYCDSITDKLAFDYDGYEITPHLDKIFIYWKLLLYFPPDDSLSYNGTYFLKSDRKEHGLFYLPNNTEFEKERLIEFFPNRLVVMMQTPQSWHCVKENHFEELRKTYNGSVFCNFNFLEKSILINLLPKGK